MCCPGAAPKPHTLLNNAGFESQCASKRHCVVVLVNSTASDSDALRKYKWVAAKVARTRRTARVVVADAKTLGAFSLAKALPAGPATALYLRKLNSAEKSALGAARATLAPATNGATNGCFTVTSTRVITCVRRSIHPWRDLEER